MKQKMKYEIEGLLNDYGDYIFGIMFVPELKKYKISALFPSKWIIPQSNTVELMNLGLIDGTTLNNIEIYSTDETKMFDNNMIDFMISIIDVNVKLEKKEQDFKLMLAKLENDFDKERNSLIETTLKTNKIDTNKTETKKSKKQHGKEEIIIQESNITTQNTQTTESGENPSEGVN
jgi:hypothetical protein